MRCHSAIANSGAVAAATSPRSPNSGYGPAADQPGDRVTVEIERPHRSPAPPAAGGSPSAPRARRRCRGCGPAPARRPRRPCAAAARRTRMPRSARPEVQERGQQVEHRLADQHRQQRGVDAASARSASRAPCGAASSSASMKPSQAKLRPLPAIRVTSASGPSVAPASAHSAVSDEAEHEQPRAPLPPRARISCHPASAANSAGREPKPASARPARSSRAVRPEQHAHRLDQDQRMSRNGV